ncbi:MAG: 50S ribosome-binding GTPase [Planctomycetes bacterium]|nr:50S ribosome-binding GTPase [Planctomycetota bacterium]
MTGPGAGAIATIQLCGDSAQTILREIFRRKGDRPCAGAQGEILLGDIVDNGLAIDEVTVGCESADTFAIHCHGNPILVAAIMELLQRHGAQSVLSEQLLARVFARQEPHDAIACEAKLALATVKTIEGAALINHQVNAGLSARVRYWRDHLDSLPLEEIAAEAGDILRHSEPARLILSGGTIALVGPPNTGKSTLLNTLAGREKAIVSDVRGTTRDWVSAEILLPPLAATIIDTAGLDPALASADIDQAAQQRSLEIVARADLILLVLDLSQPADQIATDLTESLAHKRTIIVLNKADLPPQFDPGNLPPPPRETVRISAQQGHGIGDLIGTIHRVCHVADFDPRTPVAFTDRQMHLLELLQQSESQTRARSILSELLESPVAVEK